MRARLVLAALAVLAGGMVAARAQDRIQVGYAIAGDMLPLFVAAEQGYFTAHHVDVALTPLNVVSNGPAALMSDSLQISMGTPTLILQAVAGGIDIVAVSGESRHDPANDNVSIVARTGSGIQKPADFRGRKVGIPGLGATYDILFRKWLENNGVAPGDVTYVEITIPQTNDLLKSGTLDAAAATEPMRSRIVQDGSGYRVADFVVQISPDILAAIWMAKRSWAASHAREIAAFRAALADAIGFIASHRQEVSAIEVKYLKIASPSHPVYDLSLKAADLKVYQDIMLEMTLLAQPVALDSIVAKESK